MTDSDPVDELLRRAFDGDLAQTPEVSVAARVTARIRTRQRRRLAVLGIATSAGLAMIALFIQPVITTMADALSGGQSLDWQGNGLTTALLAAAVAAWLVMMEEEQG